MPDKGAAFFAHTRLANLGHGIDFKMKLSALLLFFLVAVSGAQTGCGESTRTTGNIRSENGQELADDVLAVTKPLISGELYNRPDFESISLTRFDTSQEIQVLDTTDAVFSRVRIRKDTEELVGFVAKAILPE